MTDSRTPPPAAPLAALEARIGRTHMRQRLGIEGETDALMADGSVPVVKRDPWLSTHRLIRAGLTLAGLRGRGRRNVLDIRQRHNDVTLAGLPAAFDGYTLLHLSDLHLDIDEAFVDHLIERVQGLAYDLCVMTGDFRFRSFGPHQAALHALGRLMAHIGQPAYAVLGNHDSIRMVPAMESMGVRVLLNESVGLQHAGARLHLAGIDDAHYFRTHNLHKAVEAIEPDAPAILLSHTPEPYRLAAHSGFGLMLCGHTHGGQICLPGGIPILTDSRAPRRFARGAWQYRQMAGYTSVGCGASIVDVRLNCPPEVTLHRLRTA